MLEHGDEILAFGIESFGLFGSFVRDKDIKEQSDIDFLIEFQSNQATLRNLVNLGDFLEELTGRKVELVTRNSLSKFIGPHILKELKMSPLPDIELLRHIEEALEKILRHTKAKRSSRSVMMKICTMLSSEGLR